MIYIAFNQSLLDWKHHFLLIWRKSSVRLENALRIEKEEILIEKGVCLHCTYRGGLVLVCK